MSAEPSSTVLDEPWFQWRVEQLRKAGYPPDYAYSLARDRGIDLHDAILLVQKCGVELAFDILH